jgi:hypothetical protein
VELTIDIPSKDPALNSRNIWQWLGVKPYVDQGSLGEPETLKGVK